MKKIIKYIIFTILLIIIIFSFIKVINWIIDNNINSKETKNINQLTKIEEIQDDENTNIIENNASEDDPYWDFINMNLLNIDFNDLLKQNKDVVGWIKVNGTNINYPIVQTDNNEYYLNHSYYKKTNIAGWIFLDYRNNIEQLDKNNIIYGHSMSNKTMFGSLKNILKTEWVNNKKNYTILLSTTTKNTLWQVFSIYKINTTNDYLKVNFNTNNDFYEFGKMLLDRSEFDFNTNINENDKIITLSTCYNSNKRVVLHAKLIKESER